MSIHEMNYQCWAMLQTLENPKIPLLPSMRLQAILKCSNFEPETMQRITNL